VRRNSREGIDTVARTGGEEFHFILPATSADRAVILAERVRAAIEEHRFEGFSKPVKVTVSLGLAAYPTHASDEQTLIRVCDEAQYRAKRAGKNRVVMAAPKEMDKGADRSIVPMIENRIDNLNIIDAPTGLFNFTYFSMRMREEFRRSVRYEMPVSLLLLHMDGDHDDATRSLVLQQLSVLVRETLREGIDVATRLESGELGILLPETSAEGGAKLGARLVEIISTRLCAALNLKLTVSIGISSFPSLAARENDMLEAAVQAARKVVEMGGNGIVIAPARPASTVGSQPSVLSAEN
jgi:diguanylate cyclase (GGDEF)-like protein